MLTETLLRIPIIVIGWCFYVLQRRPLIGCSENAPKSTLPVPEFIDPVFAKTVSINSGTGFGMIFQDHRWLPTVYAFSGLKSPLYGLWRGLRKGFSKSIGTFIKASKYYNLYFSTSRHQTILKTISKCTGSAYLPFNKLFISWPKEGWNAQSKPLCHLLIPRWVLSGNPFQNLAQVKAQIRSWIHERAISLRSLGIILRVG
jgi:hypothetical protein